MERYLRRKKLGSMMDDLGLRTVIALAAFGWFSWLWGIGLPAMLAGLALGLLGQMALSRYRQHAVSRREKELRCRLGGEMLMEEMRLGTARQAHFQAAMLLGQKYPLVVTSVEDDGALCRYEGKTVLVACLRRTSESEAAAEDVLDMLRACRRHLAEKGILCLCCKESRGMINCAEQSGIPVRIVSRETMLALAGKACPATDEQLVALGRRKKSPGALGRLKAAVLHRDRAGRYMFYGTAMLMIYIFSGAGWYPLPGLTMVCLGACSRYCAGRDETL